MTKIRFDNISLGQFNKFKLVPKKKTYKTNTDKKITTKLIRGICFKEDNTYKIQIDVKCLKPDIVDKGTPDLLVLEFTEESYDLKGVTSVFSREPDKRGKYTRYIRTETNARMMPGSPERYVPFCNNWVCSGYIIRRKGKMMFDFNECIAPKGYTVMETIDDD